MGSSRGTYVPCVKCDQRTVPAPDTRLGLGQYLCYHCASCQPTKWLKKRGFLFDEGIVEEAQPQIKKVKRVGISGKRRQNRIRGIVARDGKGCLFCGCREKLTIDHIKPLAKGGTDRLDNLRLLCRTCHIERHRKELRVLTAA